MVAHGGPGQMARSNRMRHGFTIVELLIVIVVIALLAAITIVAYNGIQQRARNSQVVAGANMYHKALLQYHALNSAYPGNAGCLGADYPSNACWQGAQGNYSVSSTLDSALAPVLSSKPTLATALFSIGIGDNMRGGAVYLTSPSPRMVYYLQGTGQSCAVSGATGVNEGGVVTQCSVILP